jgi:hypothetical protein
MDIMAHFHPILCSAETVQTGSAFSLTPLPQMRREWEHPQPPNSKFPKTINPSFNKTLNFFVNSGVDDIIIFFTQNKLINCLKP